MKQLTRKTLGVLLALVMVLALLPGVTVTAQASELPTYIVAGNESAIFGSSWDGYDASNMMSLAADGTYQKTYTVDKAYDNVQLKVVKDGSTWIGTGDGDNVTFSMPGAGSFTVIIDPISQIVSVEIATEPAAPLFGTYTLTIPSALNITAPGWNATDGVSASGELPQGKTLSVTASSDGEFALVNNLNSEKKIPYALATATDATPTAVWTFDSVTAEAQTLPMGVIVEDYTDMPAGTYEDTVTFTVKVVDAAKTISIKLGFDGETTFCFADGETWQEAITNHSENSGWSCSLDFPTRVYYMNVYELAKRDGEYTYKGVNPGDAVDGEAEYRLSDHSQDS